MSIESGDLCEKGNVDGGTIPLRQADIAVLLLLHVGCTRVQTHVQIRGDHAQLLGHVIGHTC